MKKVIVVILFLITMLFPSNSLTNGEEVLVITPEMTIWAPTNYYIDFIDNITVTELVWRADGWLVLRSLVLHNNEPETLEIYFTGGNITVTRYYEEDILMSGRIYFNESIVIIKLVLRSLPTGIYVNGVALPQTSSWYTWRDYEGSIFWLDLYNHRVYIKLYRNEFSTTSLSTLFPVEQSNGVEFTIYYSKLSGQISSPSLVTVENIVALAGVIALTLVLVILLYKRNKVHINNLLEKLSRR